MTSIIIHKICAKCKNMKSILEFPISKRRIDSYCRKCKNQIKREKSKLPLSFPNHKVLTKFWENVYKTNSCWLWTGLLDKNLYGIICLQYRNVLAHRLSYMIEFGYLPSENACHKCDKPMCVNPFHIFDGSQAQNMSDMVKKNRSAKGENHSQSKLTNKDVLNIRDLLNKGYTQTCIAKIYKVNQSVISDIALKKSWTHI